MSNRMNVKARAQQANSPETYRTRIDALLAELGIPLSAFAHRQLPLFHEPAELVAAPVGPEQHEYLLHPRAAEAWYALATAASQDGVRMHVVSAFRDLESQAEIIRRKQRVGVPLEHILIASAPPGYSEHHTGRALDINTPGCRATEEEFENTDAFSWLSRHAGDFGFTLSFPRGNRYGYMFEPWHWFFGES
jgi:zinc D-Ala-D-Ala carboxypeptidase